LRHEQAEQTAKESKHEAFGQQLTHHPRARRAEGGSDRDLALPRRPAGEQQVRHIRARDQEDERHGPGKDHEGRPILARELRMQRQDASAPAGVACRKLGRERRGDGGELGLRARDADTGFELRDGLHVTAGDVTRVGRQHVRPPEIRRFARDREFLDEQPEALRHDADHGLRPAVQLDGLADDRLIAAKAALPEVVAENHDCRLRVAILRVSEGAADERRHAEDRKKRRLDGLRHDLLRVASTGQVRAQVDHGGHRVERRAALTPPYEVGRTHRVVLAWPVRAFFPERHDAMGLAERKTLEQHGVHDREDRRVGADAKCEGEYRDGGETRRAHAHPEGVANVLKQRVHQRLRRPAACQGWHTAILRKKAGKTAGTPAPAS
jgi:hypothetical protein